MNRTLLRVLPAALLLLTLACAGESSQGPAPPGVDPAGTVGASPAEAVDETEPLGKITEEELASLQTQVTASPEDTELRRRLAIGLYENGKKQESIEHFEKAAELNPGVRSFLDLGLAYGAVSRLPEAEEAYDKILAISPEHPVALHNLGNIAMKLQQNDRAIDFYQRALAAKPDYLLAQFHLGDALKRAERYEEAFAAYEKVLDLEPQDARDVTVYDNALYEMASLNIQMGAYQQAGAMLVELLRVNPKHPKANYALGQVLLALGKPEEAQKAFDAHMKILAEQEPDSPMAMGE